MRKTDDSNEVRGRTHQAFFTEMPVENAKVPVGRLLKEWPLAAEASEKAAHDFDRAPLRRV